MSMYDLFQTDSNLENKGIFIDYGSFRVTLARAGGSNRRYQKVLEAKTKPYKRAIQTETMDLERSLEILREVYIEALILNWEVNKEGTWVQGIESPEGDILPFTKENVLITLRNLPDLFTDLQQQAEKTALYRKVLQEEDAKN